MLQRKKYLMMSIAVLCLFVGITDAILPVPGWNSPYDGTPIDKGLGTEVTTEIGQLLGKGATASGNGGNSILNRLLDILGFGTEKYTSWYEKALIYIRSIINLLLWLLSLIALVIVCYSFYLMFFTEDSKGMEQVKKNLKGVAIALVVLGLSRIIVSFIFRFYTNSKEKFEQTTFHLPSAFSPFLSHLV